MAHIGTLRDFRFKDDVDDIRGADLYGREDEKLGEIDDVIFDHSTGAIQYVVVDTGGWLSSKHFMVPAGRIQERSGHENDFYADLSKEDVERFPAYDRDMSGDQDRWHEYEDRYRAHWEESGGVLHKEGSVNIITPEPSEMPAASGSTREIGDVTPTRLAGKFPDTAPEGSKLRMRPAGTAADAEDTKIPGHAREASDMESARQGSLREQSKEEAAKLRREGSSPSFAGDASARVPLTDNNVNAGDVGYGDSRRTAVPSQNTSDLPPSYRNSVDGSLDPSNDLHRPYPVQQGRSERWRKFEDRLREHRTEVTSSCGVCKIDKDRAA